MLIGGAVLDVGRLHIGDDVVLDALQVSELLVEVSCDQQNRVVQFALLALDGAVSEMDGDVGRADGDGGNQQAAAQDEALDRPALKSETAQRGEASKAASAIRPFPGLCVVLPHA